MRPITGNTISQTMHGKYNAVDYHSSPDPIAYAPEDVTFLTYLQNSGDCGNNLQVRGANGVHGFCHVEESYISPGQTINKGQPLFKMGYNGLVQPPGPAGRHAHWVLLVGTTYVYPPSHITEPFGSGEDQQMTQEAAEKLVSKAYRAATDIDPTQEQAAYWVARIRDDPNKAHEIMDGLGASDYKGDPLFRQKARDYDKDLATASGGYKETKVFVKE